MSAKALKNLNADFDGLAGSLAEYGYTFPRYRYSSGVKLLTKEHRCGYLIMFIFYYQKVPMFRDAKYQAWEFTIKGGSISASILADGKPFGPKVIGQSDTMPDSQVTFWLSNQVLYLPSELRSIPDMDFHFSADKDGEA
jgi:hypothetical protein